MTLFEHATLLELFWTVPAGLCFFLTLGSIVWVVRVFRTLHVKIVQEPQRYRAWGPRWNFLVFLTVALAFFAVGWLGYAAIGFVAMMTPPASTEENRDAATMLAYILISMEAMHALAQVFLLGGLLALAES